MLGEARRKQGAFSEAISAYQMVAELSPEDAEPLVQIATCNIQMDLLDAARNAVNRALQLNPGHREAAYLAKHLGEMQTPHKPGF